MIIILKNEFLINDNILKEYIVKIACKNILIYGTFFSFASFILSVLSIRQNHTFQLGLYLAIFIVLLLTTYITPFLLYKQIKKQGKILHNNKTYKTITTFDDKIYFNEGSFSTTFEYKQITKVYKLKTCYVLMAGKIPIIIEQNSFIDATLEDFLQLIKEKCIGLKI
ncbi:hypothetical protein [uncultured Tyzzerella sp.]|uniref:hypothetical protein n=1 Tax=uncultured Tyzzerella sp. TaxID=2321398 RepID=UPI0029434F6B|nr:hypothetical protein [uncultured Tyzzerella sp.]